MQAKETKLQDILEGTKQYIVPLFQRTYSWDRKEWDILWKDLLELCNEETPRPHFIGSIVTMPTISVPEGVSKFLLIDGQQRLTTIFLLLAILRNRASESGKKEFADEINNTLLVNPYKKGNDHYKLIPTQVDREAYYRLINAEGGDGEDQLAKAFDFFDRKARQAEVPPEQLKKAMTSYFSVVSIVLDVDDNPYLVFESLNAKGRPLSQADLIRNYLFMRIHVDEQDDAYKKLWYPMQESLGENLTEYIRHFLMRAGSFIKQNDVYYSLKDQVVPENAVNYLKELAKYSKYYVRLLDPRLETRPEIRERLHRLNLIEVTTAYPLLLNFYSPYANNILKWEEFADMLSTLENFLVRRFVAGIPTNQLNKIFAAVIPQLDLSKPRELPGMLRQLLQSRGYPKDATFRSSFVSAKLYGAGDRLVKTRLILESMEEQFHHKEPVAFDNLTIEHVMPQTLSEWWQESLGEDWEVVHELYLHNIGNLTLTAYNTEMSNDDFPSKKEVYKASHLELNKYFAGIEKWGREQIESRAEKLADIAISVWPYFGKEGADTEDIGSVRGTTPASLWVLGQKFEVSSWRDVLQSTLDAIADLEPEKFEMLLSQYPRFVGKDKSKFRAVRELKNGTFVEVNLSAQAIERFCRQVIETIDLTSEDWKVAVK